MAEMRVDALVLGAGMVGVSTALHLQQRGRSVTLVDRHAQAAMETSFGNTGIIQREALAPYMFPRDLRLLLKYALNASSEAHYQIASLPTVLPWLLRYFLASTPARAAATARAALPLIARCLDEHRALARAAGADERIREVGWIKLFRSDALLKKAESEAAEIRSHGLGADFLDGAALHALEPHISGVAGALHMRDPGLVADPQGLAQAYADLFVARGGRFVQGEARSLAEAAGGWRIDTAQGAMNARDAVIALGPWSDDVFRPLGYKIPLGIKRGYHMHYAPQGNAVLNHSVLDVDAGYCLAPMTRGIRLTTGAEFARRDAPPTPVQIAQCEPVARGLFPLAQRLDDTAWMGCRPCLPDMLPVIGRAARHKGLWFNFGHQHHGLTLGPVSGGLLAEMMCGEATFTDAAVYGAERFG